LVGGRRVLAGVLLALTLAISGSQTLTRGYLYSNIGTLFTWASSAQAGWNGSSQVATCADFATYIQNDGTPCVSSVATLLDSYALAHAVNSVTHSPLVANGTFLNGTFSPWTSANTGACSGVITFAGQPVSPDYNGDNGVAAASSGTCVATPAETTLTQVFSIAGTPTVQTYFFAYRALQSTYGDPDCTVASGSVSMLLKMNGTTVASIASPALDGAWHTVSGTMTAMANGSNTLVLDATLAGATGATQIFRPGIGDVCKPAVTVAQPLQVDDFILSAVF